MNLCYGLEISLSNLLKAHLWKGRVTGRGSDKDGGESERRTWGNKTAHLQVHSPDTLNSLGWASLEPEASNSIWISHGGKGPALQSLSAVFTGALAGWSWKQRSQDLNQHSKIRFGNPKW